MQSEKNSRPSNYLFIYSSFKQSGLNGWKYNYTVEMDALFWRIVATWKQRVRGNSCHHLHAKNKRWFFLFFWKHAFFKNLPPRILVVSSPTLLISQRCTISNTKRKYSRVAISMNKCITSIFARFINTRMEKIKLISYRVVCNHKSHSYLKVGVRELVQRRVFKILDM